ncbi:Thiamine pyrophosphate enzyme, C-terminal TPP binding domain [Burkholderia sp. OK233]|nr:Thiamine pyrophosphate enzyme, C-terminal TPP binding domain [Burkholderia sp. OK233]
MNTSSSASSLATSSVSIDRREFVARLLALCPNALVVTGLGSPTYDVFAAGDSDRYFYLWGAMGGSTSIALGLALAQPDRPVLAITGDGEQLMGVGSLATAGVQQPPNLSVVVLDNGHFGETGMQRSHSSLGTKLAQVARACGIEQATEIHSLDGVEALATRINARSGLNFAQVHVKADELPRALPSRDGVFVKNRFRQALGFASL